MRIISTCGIARSSPRSASSRSSARSNGSPPETSTSRTSGCARRYVDPLGPRLPAEHRLSALRDAPAGAVAAVGRAAVEREEERPVRVLVHDRRDRTVRILAQRVAQLARPDARLGPRGNRLHPHRAERVLRVDQRQVVRRDAQPEDLRGSPRTRAARPRSGAPVARAAPPSGWSGASATASRPTAPRSPRGRGCASCPRRRRLTSADAAIAPDALPASTRRLLPGRATIPGRIRAACTPGRSTRTGARARTGPTARCPSGSSWSSTRSRARGRTRPPGAPSACRRRARHRRSAASRTPAGTP